MNYTNRLTCVSIAPECEIIRKIHAFHSINGVRVSATQTCHQWLSTIKLITPHHIQQVVITPLLLAIILLTQYSAVRRLLFSTAVNWAKEIVRLNVRDMEKNLIKPVRRRGDSLCVYYRAFTVEYVRIISSFQMLNQVLLTAADDQYANVSADAP